MPLHQGTLCTHLRARRMALEIISTLLEERALGRDIGKGCGVKNLRLEGERAAQFRLSSASCEPEWRDAFLSSTEYLVTQRDRAFSLVKPAAPGVGNHNLAEEATSSRHGSAQDRPQCPVRWKDGGRCPYSPGQALNACHTTGQPV